MKIIAQVQSYLFVGIQDVVSLNKIKHCDFRMYICKKI